MPVISNLVVALTANTSGFTKKVGGASASVRGLSSSATSAAAGVGSLVTKLGLAAGALAGVGSAAAAAFSGFKSAAALEQAQVSLETMLGSASEARRVLSELDDFAASTPFQFTELQRATTKLIAFGSESGSVVGELRRIGDIASGVGAPVGELAELFGKARVQGTLYAEDINQLVGRGIPVIEEFAKQFGVSQSEVKKLASEGKIKFSNLQTAFRDLTGEGGRFAEMMKKQSGTLAGIFSTLKDNVSATLRDIAIQIIDVFRIKDAIAAIAGGMSAIRSRVVGGVSMVAGYVRSGLSGIVGFIAPVAASIAGVVSSAVSFIGSAFMSGVKAIGSLLGAMGINLQSTGRVLTWLRDTAVGALLTMEFGFKNWQAVVEIAAVSSAAKIVTFANQVTHFLTKVIPAALSWFADNWREILLTVGANTLTFFENLFSNIAKVVMSLPDIIRGNMDFSDVWKPLSDGFLNVIKEMPDIPAREIGGLEKMLNSQAADLGKSLGKSYDKFVGERMAEIDTTAASLASAADGALSLDIDTPEVPNLKLAPDSMEAMNSFGKGEVKQLTLAQIGIGKIRQPRAGIETGDYPASQSRDKSDGIKEKQGDAMLISLKSIEAHVKQPLLAVAG